jgi:hypothetical protein
MDCPTCHKEMFKTSDDEGDPIFYCEDCELCEQIDGEVPDIEAAKKKVVKWVNGNS